MQELIIENIPVSFYRKNIKNINLRVTKPNGEVKVSAPYLMSMKTIEKFISKNKDWIIKTQKKIIDNSKNSSSSFLLDPYFAFETGDKIQVWGQQYVLEVLPSSRWNLILNEKIHRANFYVTHNSDSKLRQSNIRKCYKKILLEQAGPIFNKWLKITGLAPSKIDVRFTKSVWGTCNNKTGRIMLNGQLAGLDIKYLDYVILHELTHLKYSNHGNDFKAFMTKYMPEWKLLRKELNGQIESK